MICFIMIDCRSFTILLCIQAVKPEVDVRTSSLTGRLSLARSTISDLLLPEPHVFDMRGIVGGAWAG